LLTPDQLRELFLHSSDRRYYLIRRTVDQKPLGRFYYRAWDFGDGGIDWELNIFIRVPPPSAEAKLYVKQKPT
jgi:hypothetical protein